MSGAVVGAQSRRRTPGRLRILISSGPTQEPIDPVRFLSNRSTGYMGAALADEALARGHRVCVVSGPVAEPLPKGAQIWRVETCRQMASALQRLALRADAIIMAAAVADFQAARVARTKLPRRGRRTLILTPTPDILAGLPRKPRQVRVGFALETHAVVPRALEKLRRKRLDVLLAQRAIGAEPFGRRRVHAWLIATHAGAANRRPRETVQALGKVSKGRVARVLLDKIEALWYGQPRHA